MFARDANLKIISKTVYPKDAPSVGNVGLIGLNSIELNNVLVGGSAVVLSADKLNATSVTPGVAAANKIAVLDVNKSITGLGAISTDELYVNDTLITGIVNKNNPTKNIYPGVVSEGKALTTNSELAVGGMKAITSSTFKVNQGEIKEVNTKTIIPKMEIHDKLQFVEKIPYTPVTLAANYISGGKATAPWHFIVKVGNYYLYIPLGDITISTSYRLYTTQTWYRRSNLSAALEPLPETTTYIPSNIKCFDYDQTSGRYFVIVIQTDNVLKCMTWTNNDPTVLTSTIVSGSLSRYVNIKYVPCTGKIYVLYILTNPVLKSSVDGITWADEITVSSTQNPLLTYNADTVFLVGNTTTYYLPSGTSTWLNKSTPTDLTSQLLLTYSNAYYDSTTNSIYITLTRYSAERHTLYKTTDFTTVSKVIPDYAYINSVNSNYFISSRDGHLYISCFNGTTVINLTDNTYDNFELIHYDGECMYIPYDNCMWRYTYTPTAKPAITYADYPPEQYLDFESYKGTGIYDYVYVESINGYYVLGTIGDQYTAAPSAPYVYYSKDLTRFTPLSVAPDATIASIAYNPDSDTIMIYPYNSATVNVYYSSNKGVSWTASTPSLINTKYIYYCKTLHMVIVCKLTTIVVCDHAYMSTGTGFNHAVSGGSANGGNYCLTNGGLFYYKTEGSLAEYSSILYSLYSKFLWSSLSYNVSSAIFGINRYSYEVSSLYNTYSLALGSGVNEAYPIYADYEEAHYKLHTATTGTTPAFAEVYPIYISGFLTPVYIEPLDIYVAMKASAGGNSAMVYYTKRIDYYTYSSLKATTGYANIWKPLYHTRVVVNSIKNPYAIRYNPIDGYVYILGGSVAYRTKISLFKNEIQSPNLCVRDVFGIGYSPKTGYEFYKLITAPVPTAVSTTNWQSLDYGYGAYVAVGTDVICYGSIPYGLTTQSLTGVWTGVAYGTHSNTWIAVGTNVVAFASGSFRSATFASSVLSGSWVDISYSYTQKKWVAVGVDTVGVCTDSTTFSTAALAGSWNRIVYTNNTWIATSTNNIAYSVDGTIWSTVTLTGDWKSIVWGGGKYVLVGTNVVAMGESLSGMLIHNITGSYKDVCFVDGLEQFVLVGTSLCTILRHGDLIGSRIEITTTKNIKRCAFAYRLNAIIMSGDGYIGATNSVSCALDNVPLYNTSTAGGITTDTGTTSALSIRTGVSVEKTINLYTATSYDQLKMVNTTDNSVASIGYTTTNVLNLSADVVNFNSDTVMTPNGLFIKDINTGPLIGMTPNTAQASLAVGIDSGTITVGALKTKGVLINSVLYSPTITPETSTAGISEANKAVVVGTNGDITTPELSSSKVQWGDIIVTGDNKVCKPWSCSYVDEFGLSYYVKDMIYQPVWKCYIAIVNPNEGSNTRYKFSDAEPEKLFYLVSKDGVNWYRQQTGLRGIAVQLFTDSGPEALWCPGDVANPRHCVWMIVTESEAMNSKQSSIYCLTDPDNCIAITPSVSNTYMVADSLVCRVEGLLACTNANMYVSVLNSSLTTNNKYHYIIKTGALASYPINVSGTYNTSVTGIVKPVLSYPAALIYCTTTSFNLANLNLTSGGVYVASDADLVMVGVTDAVSVVSNTALTTVMCGTGKVWKANVLFTNIATFANFPAGVVGDAYTVDAINASCQFSGIAHNTVSDKYCVVSSSRYGEIYVTTTPGSLSAWTKIDHGYPYSGNGEIMWGVVRNAYEDGFVIANRANSKGINSDFIARVDQSGNYINGFSKIGQRLGRGCYAFGKWLVPCNFSNKKLMYSYDGSTWKYSNLTYYYYLGNSHGVVYSLTLDIAVTTSYKNIYSSTNGIDWTLRHTISSRDGGSYFSQPFRILWVEYWGLFVMMLGCYDVNAASTTNLLTSPNGVDWTERAIMYGGNVDPWFREMIYSEKLHRAIIIKDQYGAGPHYYSDNGIDWIPGNIPSSETRVVVNRKGDGGSVEAWWSATNEYFYYKPYASTKQYVSYDGISWVLAPTMYNTEAKAFVNQNYLYGLTYVDGIGEVAAYHDSISDAHCLVTVGKGMFTPFAKLQGKYNVDVPYAGMIYSQSTNQLLTYRRTANTTNSDDVPSEVFQLFDLGEYTKLVTSEVCIDRLAKLYQSPDINNAVANWSILSPVSMTFAGKMRWIQSVNAFIAVSGTSVLSGNHMMYSYNGYTWAKVPANTSVFPDNTTATSICELPGIQSLLVGISGGAGNKLAYYDSSSTTAVAMATTSYTTNSIYSVYYSPKHKCIFMGTSDTASIYMADINFCTNAATTHTTMVKYITKHTLPTAMTITSMTYMSHIDRLVCLPSSGTSFVYLDGEAWKTGTLDVSAGSFNGLDYSKKLGMAVGASASGYISVSTDGVNWTSTLQSGYVFTDVIWAPELEVFIASSSTASVTPLLYSVDGTTWVPIMLPSSVSVYSICWGNTLGSLLLATGTGVMVSVPIVSRALNAIARNSSTTSNSANPDVSVTSDGYLHIRAGSATPYKTGDSLVRQFQLYVATDSAWKPTSATWTVTSDERLKDNIEVADLSQCTDVLCSVPLKYYKWKDEFAEETNTTDMHNLGWIAQDVQKVLPKSVKITSHHGLDDALTLNSDQLVACMYGAVQDIGKRIEALERSLTS